MSNLGKIFIYEKTPEQLEKYRHHFETNGFFTFGTDNLYFLTQYAKEINPDIIIINLPLSIKLSNEAFIELEEKLCQAKSCPQIYINYQLPYRHKPQFHYWNFDTQDLNYEQILQIINDSNKKYLN
ncbi:MAG: hypothetical protein E7016_00660 [Alphaproteobacteria bacterium]|nr:hypothetical protein [Alphaproteobacteria bacterium]